MVKKSTSRGGANGKVHGVCGQSSLPSVPMGPGALDRFVDSMLGVLSCLGVATLLVSCLVVVPLILFVLTVTAIRVYQFVWWGMGQ